MVGFVKPKVHKPARSAVDVETLKVQMYRGMSVDVSALTAEQKKELRAALDADSKSEMTFKHPDREVLRETLRQRLA